MMNNELRPYESYKRVDLPWVNEIPESWKIQRGKQLFKSIDERTTTGEEELLSVSANFGVVKRKNANVTMFKAASYVGYKLCWEKDLAVNSLWAWQQGLGFSKYHGIISTAYSVYRLRSENENHKFYDYLLRSTIYLWELRVRSKGIWRSRYQLHDSSFMDMPFIVPPRSEQDQIVKYLDHQLAKINKFIKAKKKLIAVLKEQKQAIINEAVTKGLDPNVKMKPSGIEWLGDVPEHWEIKTIKHVAKLMNGKNYNIVYGGSVPVYGSGGKFAETNMVMHEGPSVLLGRKGTIDKPIIVNEPFWCVDTAFYIESFRNVLLEYFYFYSLIIDYNRFLSKTALPSMTQTTLNNIKIIIPGINEQSEIVEFIIGKTSLIDRNIELIENEIKLVNEFKNSLISDVVTGQVDVRNILIEELEEEIVEDIELDEDSIDEESLEAEEGDE